MSSMFATLHLNFLLNFPALKDGDSSFTEILLNFSRSFNGSSYRNVSYSYYLLCRINNPSFKMFLAALASLSMTAPQAHFQCLSFNVSSPLTVPHSKQVLLDGNHLSIWMKSLPFHSDLYLNMFRN